MTVAPGSMFNHASRDIPTAMSKANAGFAARLVPNTDPNSPDHGEDS